MFLILKECFDMLKYKIIELEEGMHSLLIIIIGPTNISKHGIEVRSNGNSRTIMILVLLVVE